MKKIITISISEKLVALLQDLAIEQNRPMSNLIETMIYKHFSLERGD